MAGFYRTRAAWLIFFTAGFIPFVYILVVAFQGSLGAEPAKALVEYLGEVAILLLLLVLSLTPLRRISVLSGLNRFRRMLGLFVFFYALLHLSAYALLLVDWQNFVEDLYSRLYVTAGFVAFVILLLLALTSPRVMVRRLGRRWKPLHRMVYLAVFVALIHVFWQVRSDYTEVASYALIALVLLSFRLSYFKKRVFGV